VSAHNIRESALKNLTNEEQLVETAKITASEAVLTRSSDEIRGASGGFKRTKKTRATFASLFVQFDV
jgi:hypothetical protein